MTDIRKITTASGLLLAGLALSSCESFGPKGITKLPLTPPKNEQPGVVFEQLQNKPSATETEKRQPELIPGTDRFVPVTPPQHRAGKGRGEAIYNLNFNEADLTEVAKVILGDILGQNYVVSPKVAGKITLQTTQALTKDEVLPTLEMVLRMNNAALIKDGRVYRIEPSADAMFQSDLSGPGYQIKAIPVQNVSVDELAKLIKPLVQEKAILTVDGARNMMVAAGSSEELARIMDLVNTFDIDVLRGRSFGLFPLTHVGPETIIKELEAVFNKKGGADDNPFFRFIPIERLNSVLAITHKARYLEDIQNWVERLDRATAASGGGVNVYKVQHVDAVDLADTLNDIFSGSRQRRSERAARVAPGQTPTEMTNRSPNDLSSALNATTGGGGRQQQRADRQLFGMNSINTGQTTGEARVSNVGDVRIIADEPNNSVIVVATAQEYEVILPVIKQLDVMPLQVLIDATVVEVTLKDELKYGLQWFFDSGNFHGLLTQVASGDLKNIGPLTGFSMAYTGGTVKAVLNALADKSLVNVIASPSLMVLNNQSASINVGDKVPIATSQATNTSSANTSVLGNVSAIVTNTIQMVETGVTLKITPRVNAGGLVIMEVEQEANQAIPTSTSTLNSPTIQQRKINSSVVVKGGETVVLGGLIQEQTTNSVTGLPYLSSLPIIGPLFGTITKANNKTELVVLVTPRVVQNTESARAVTNEFKRKLTGIYEESPVRPVR